MQTFLPWPNAAASAACLDAKRLGKQVVEGYQIMKCLAGDASSSWNSHPIIGAWRGCEATLMSYLDVVHAEWRSRRDSDAVHTAYAHCRELFDDHFLAAPESLWWLGSPGFHLSHQLNLIRKDEAYRATFAIPSPFCVDNEPYLWPASHGFFQVATRSNGVSYASWFGSGSVTGRRLVISAEEADSRVKQLFPEAASQIEAGSCHGTEEARSSAGNLGPAAPAERRRACVLVPQF
jgi:Pyrimidine dimer DNA glycosylase